VIYVSAEERVRKREGGREGGRDVPEEHGDGIVEGVQDRRQDELVLTEEGGKEGEMKEPIA